MRSSLLTFGLIVVVALNTPAHATPLQDAELSMACPDAVGVHYDVNAGMTNYFASPYELQKVRKCLSRAFANLTQFPVSTGVAKSATHVRIKQNGNIILF